MKFRDVELKNPRLESVSSRLNREQSDAMKHSKQELCVRQLQLRNM